MKKGAEFICPLAELRNKKKMQEVVFEAKRKEREYGGGVEAKKEAKELLQQWGINRDLVQIYFFNFTHPFRALG